MTAVSQEYWNELQFQVSQGHLDDVKELLLKNPVGYDANMISENTAVPRVSPLHIACRIGGMEMVKVLLPHCDVNVADQVTDCVCLA
jgi:ankyrin repeat protein